MNYAVEGRTVFQTKKPLTVNKKLSDSAKSRFEYIRSHDFSVTIDKSSGQPNVKITKKHE